ncbi:MAG: hypothetical protein ACT4RN_24140 [Pseudonocardia sp.]
MTTANAIDIAELLDALKAWLSGGGDLDEFAADSGVSVEDISDSWNTYFSPDFSRDYNINNSQSGGPAYTPQPPPAGGSPGAMKEYILQEVHNHQVFTTVNNIEDNSFNQQIVAGGDVHQDLDIDNSDNIAEDSGVVIRDSDLHDSNVVTGDDNVVDSEDVLDGDVTTTAGPGGQAQSGINFGEGEVNQNQQDQDVDVTTSGDNTGGDGGPGYSDGPIPVEPDGGPGAPILLDEPAEPALDQDYGDGGDAGHDVDVHVTQEAPVF